MKILGLNLSDDDIILNNCCISIEISYFKKTADFKKELEKIQIFASNEYEAESGRDTIEINYKAFSSIEDNEKAEKFSDIISRYASSVQLLIARTY